MIITSVEFEPCVMSLEDKNWTFALGTFVALSIPGAPRNVAFAIWHR